MSSYSFQGRKRFWTPRDEEENRAIFSTVKQETGIKMPNEFKPVYYAHAENEVEKWSLKRLIRLLRLYGAHRCLWDIRDPDNRNRKLRKAALVDITAAIGEGVTRVQVVQKINVLRATYRYEKRRIKQRIRKGIGAKTKLKWFALADAFLRNVPRVEKLRRNVQAADSDSDLEDAVVFTIDPETLIPLDEDEGERDPVLNNSNTQERAKEQHIDAWSGNSGSDFNEKFLGEDIEVPLNEINSSTAGNEEGVDLNATPVENTYTFKASTKQVWTTKESLQFVKLLKKHPGLWCSPVKGNRAQAAQATSEIANAMRLSTQRVDKRVQTFRRCCKNELEKIAQNNAYKPNFVWWSLAASFITPTTTTVSPFTIKSQHFVDANEPQPSTPLNMLERHIKSEIDQADALSNPETPINPISSVGPNAPRVEEDFRTLFHNESDSRDKMISDCDTKRDANICAANTQLIWHGLEDDLLEGKWSLKHSVKFLRLYGAHRCLWDLNDPDYRSRELRHAAVEDIAAAMGYGLDAEYVAKKIKIFRITYMQHRKRMLESIKQGKQPEIQLRWFPLADSFLRPHIGLRCIKKQELEMPQFDFQYVYANLNLIDPALLTDFRGKGTQNTIEIGAGSERAQHEGKERTENNRIMQTVKQENP